MDRHLFESALQSGNFWIRYQSGIVRTLNPDILSSGDITKSSPRKGRARYKFSAHDACSIANTPRGVGIRVNPDTCGRGHFWIRKEKVADSKISGYVWTGSKANCLFQISLYSGAYVRITIKKTKSEFPWDHQIPTYGKQNIQNIKRSIARPKLPKLPEKGQALNLLFVFRAKVC